VGPAATFLGAAVVAWAALAQARTARLRHDEQTRADIHRRITESFSKAAEQLGSDKLAVRLGGIYTMERISRESWTDYWPAMETLSAIVRESGRLTQQTDSKITTDVAAVMEVLSRRSSDAKKYEVENHLFFDLSNADLRGAELYNLDFYAAQMNDVNLQGAELRGCKFKYGRLGRVNFSDADLSDIELSGAFLDDANFRGMRGENCSLYGTSLAHAEFTDAKLELSSFERAHCVGTILTRANLRDSMLTWYQICWATYDEPPVIDGAALVFPNNSV
jgi:hypothetical protein